MGHLKLSYPKLIMFSFYLGGWKLDEDVEDRNNKKINRMIVAKL